MHTRRKKAALIAKLLNSHADLVQAMEKVRLIYLDWQYVPSDAEANEKVHEMIDILLPALAAAKQTGGE